MHASLYIFPFVTAFIISLLVNALLVCKSSFFHGRFFDNRRQPRHIHKKNVVRFGGVAFMLSFFLAISLDKNIVLTDAWIGVIIAIIPLLTVGFWDDISEISWKTQLFFQTISAGVVFFFGVRIHMIPNPFGDAIPLDSGVFLLSVSFCMSIVWIIAIMNAINWFDGVDGLSGGISFIGFMTIFFLSLKPEVYQPPVAILSLILAGLSLGFLAFNFYPAKIFAGTGGVWFLGFMLATLAMFSGMKIATSLLVLFLPLADALWVLYDRWRSKAALFEPDNRHLHHRLRRLGWSQIQIVAALYSATCVIAVAALYSRGIEKFIIFCALFAIAIILFEWMNVRMMRGSSAQ